MRFFLRIANCGLLLILAGCSSLAPYLSTPLPAYVQPATPTPQPILTQPAPAETQARILRVWLPPQFDPNAGTASANLLKQRLADFEAQHSGLEIEVRIKAEEGEWGLLNSLTITSLAAPAALPDLIAFSRHDLEAAALQGLLHPMDGLSTSLQDPNWYGYARELGHIQNAGYGLPFAGNALAFVYRPELKELANWDDVLASKGILVFPANDPQGLVALSLYVSAGGKVLNEQGLPTLDEDVLTRVLLLIQKGVSTRVLSPSLATVSTDDQALQAYRAGSADMAIIWTLDYRSSSDGIIMPVPGLGESPHSFVTGWLWSLAGSSPENQQLAVELAEYLVADDFLREWIRETGYLPTRPSIVNEDATLTAILESAQPIPPNEVSSVLGPLMQEALTRVLNGEQAEVVAGSVIESLK